MFQSEISIRGLVLVKVALNILKSIAYKIREYALMIFLLLQVVIFVPIFLYMMWFSYTQDPTARFHGDKYELQVATTLLNGEAVSHYERLDERQIQQLFIRNLEAAHDVAIVGSSRGLQMSEEIFGDIEMFNYGMVSADYVDLCNTAYLFVREDKVPKNLIMVVDPWILLGEDYVDERSDKELYSEFLSLALGVESNYIPPDTEELYSVLFDPSFFQSAVTYYYRDSSGEQQPQTVDEQEKFQQATEVKDGDGTIIYTEDYRNRPQEAIDHDALVLANIEETFVHGFPSLDPAQLENFETLLEYIEDAGTNIIFVLTPYHPIVYTAEVEKSEQYPGMLEAEQYLYDLAAQKNIPIYGSYNPENVDCTNEDFYDHIHVTREGLSNYISPLLDDLKDVE